MWVNLHLSMTKIFKFVFFRCLNVVFFITLSKEPTMTLMSRTVRLEFCKPSEAFSNPSIDKFWLKLSLSEWIVGTALKVLVGSHLFISYTCWYSKVVLWPGVRRNASEYLHSLSKISQQGLDTRGEQGWRIRALELEDTHPAKATVRRGRAPKPGQGRPGYPWGLADCPQGEKTPGKWALGKLLSQMCREDNITCCFWVTETQASSDLGMYYSVWFLNSYDLDPVHSTSLNV